MKYVMGAVVLPFAVWMLWGAAAKWQRVRAARLAMPAGWDAAAGEDTNPLSLAGIGEMVLPLVLATLAVSGFACVAIYQMTNGARVMSLFDLGAVLFTMAAYAVNFTVKVKCRMPKDRDRLAGSAGQAGAVLLRATGNSSYHLRQPYAPEGLNKTYNNGQDQAPVVTSFVAGPAALEQTP